MEQKLLERPLPVQWGNGSRAFWTKRKKTAGSLFAILALIAGIAAAYLLFDRTVPNNVVREASRFDFEVHVQRPFDIGETIPNDPNGAQFTGSESGVCNTARATLAQDADNGDWCQAGSFANGGGPVVEPIFEGGISSYPGDTSSATRRSESVRIYNTNKPAREATIWMHVPTIVVKKCTNGIVDGDRLVDDGTGSKKLEPVAGKGDCVGGESARTVVPDGTEKTQFLNFWNLEVVAEKVASVIAGTDGETEVNQNRHDSGAAAGDLDPENHDGTGSSQTKTVCAGPLRQISLNSKCNLGMVEGNGAQEGIGGGQSQLQQTDVRWYTFRITQVDTGTDQSAFKGWTAEFVFAFQAQVPAVPESTTGER